jgi:hypothetical protein
MQRNRDKREKEGMLEDEKKRKLGQIANLCHEEEKEKYTQGKLA